MTLERARRSAALPVALALVVYLVLGYGVGRPFGEAGDPTYFIHAGQAYRAPEMLPPDAFIETSTGYDGQFFFYLAQDPLLTGKAATRDQETSDHIDNVAYRYQRILLPLAGWLVSWGHPSVLQWTLPLLNLAAVLAATWLLAVFLRSRGRPTWAAVAFPLSMGVVVGVFNDVSDPIGAALFLMGVLWWLDRRTAAAVAALTACIFARELYVLPVAVLAVAELVRSRRAALPWLIPLAVFGAWQAYLRLAFAASPTEGSHGPSAVPIRGVIEKVRTVVREDLVGAANWELAFLAFVLICWAYFAVRAVASIRAHGRAPTREQVFPLVGLGALFLFPFLTDELLANVPSYTRYAAAVGGLLVIAFGLWGDAMSRFLLVGSTGLLLFNPIVAVLPTRHQGLVRPPAPLSPQESRAGELARCIEAAGVVARRTEDAPPGASVVTLSTSGGRAGSVYVFGDEAAARKFHEGLRGFVGPAGDVELSGSVIVSWPRGAEAADAGAVTGCLG
ncbi:MAG: hypothetical protein JW895_01030 [Thermoleophilaceae bacterium]|nr:hypothetical protein [Thermoleophilaceae bacterium]